MDMVVVGPEQREDVDRLRRLAGAFIAGYASPDTRAGYRSELRRWFTWMAGYGVGPLQAERVHVEVYARWLEQRGLAAATIARTVTVLSSFYRWLVDEDVLAVSPVVRVRRPKRSAESTRVGLRRTELLDGTVNAAQAMGVRYYAFACLLAFNALRIGELARADVGDLGESDWHHTLRVVGKGGKPALVPLAPRTRRAVELAVGDRVCGPLVVNRDGRRLSRQLGNIWTKRIAGKAGITKDICSHSLRHSSITAALNAGADLRDVQDFARHADPRTTECATTGHGAAWTATRPTSSPSTSPGRSRPSSQPGRRGRVDRAPVRGGVVSRSSARR